MLNLTEGHQRRWKGGAIMAKYRISENGSIPNHPEQERGRPPEIDQSEREVVSGDNLVVG